MFLINQNIIFAFRLKSSHLQSEFSIWRRGSWDRPVKACVHRLDISSIAFREMNKGIALWFRDRDKAMQEYRLIDTLALRYARHVR